MQNWQPTTISNIPEENKLSVYQKGTVTPDIFASGVKTLMDAYPKLNKNWYSVLREMIKDEKFSNERFSDAIKHCIKHCQYPEPTISNIINYDKHVKVYTYSELLSIKREASAIEREMFLKEFDMIDVNGEIRYAKKEEVKTFNLKVYEHKSKIKPFIVQESIDVEEEETQKTVEDLANQMQARFYKKQITQKKLTQQEREERRRKFQAILESEGE